MVKNSQATISCVISGLTQQLDAVTWEKPDEGGVITHNVDGYEIVEGSYNSGSNSQTTVLTISADKNTADSVYTCIITSNEHAVSAAKTEVHSNVFSKCIISKLGLFLIVQPHKTPNKHKLYQNPPIIIQTGTYYRKYFKSIQLMLLIRS